LTAGGEHASQVIFLQVKLPDVFKHLWQELEVKLGVTLVVIECLEKTQS